MSPSELETLLRDSLGLQRVYDREALLAYGDCAQLNFPEWDSSSFKPIPTKHWTNQYT